MTKSNIGNIGFFYITDYSPSWKEAGEKTLCKNLEARNEAEDMEKHYLLAYSTSSAQPAS